MRIRFDECIIDTEQRQLLRAGDAVVLSPKAYQLLMCLVEARPKALSKDALSESLWPNTFVVEANLSNLIGEIRAALGDSAQRSRYIRTLHGFGYAFCAATQNAESESENASAPIIAYLVLADGRPIPIRTSESVIGRSLEAHIHLDLPGVSRRHARIVVAGDVAQIEDLDSKNGTYVGGTRVRSAISLKSGDDVSFGSAQVTFHVASHAVSTETTVPRSQT
jgi:DNA-binding winged helix-turn-helix (wHTH) protein